MNKIKVLELEELDGLQVLVHDGGTIQTLSHTHIRSNGRVDNRKGKILHPKIDRYGYKAVCLTNNGKRKHYTVHKLVASAFIPNPSNKPTVNHKNGIKTDTRVENLEWATQREQKRHSIIHHLCDKNLSALAEASRRQSRKVFFRGKEFPSINAARRANKVAWRTIIKEGVFL